MRKRQHTLLAGVAALALIAGAGVAAAQQNPQGQAGSTPGSAGASIGGQSSTHAQTGSRGASGGMEQHAQGSGGMGGGQTGSSAQNAQGSKSNQPSLAQGSAGLKGQNRSAETNQKNAGQNAKQSAQNDQQRFGENAKGKGNAHERFGRAENKRHERYGQNARLQRSRSSAQNGQQQNGRVTAQSNARNGKLKGLQGNASVPMQGSHVSLTSQQRTRIRETVIDARNAPRVGHVDFDIRVGTLVPRRGIRIVPVPRTLVEIDPAWRGYLYFVARDQVIIVNPRDMRIVAVLPA